VTSLPVGQFLASIDVLQRELAHLQSLVCKYSVEFYNTAVRVTADPLPNLKSEYKAAQSAVEKVIQAVLNTSEGSNTEAQAVQDADEIIRGEGKGAIKTATKKTTKIRGAIAISSKFAQKFYNLIPTDSQADRAAIPVFLEAYKLLELAKSSKYEALQEVEKELEKAAESISSKNLQGSQHHPAIVNVSGNPIFDFYFTVLEKKDFSTIFDEALGELTDAMKQIEAQKEVEEVETSNGENSDSETSDGEDSDGEREEDSDQDVEMEDVASPTQNNKKRCASRPRFSSIKKFPRQNKRDE